MASQEQHSKGVTPSIAAPETKDDTPGGDGATQSVLRPRSPLEAFFPSTFSVFCPASEDYALRLIQKQWGGDPVPEGTPTFEDMLAGENPSTSVVLHLAAFWGYERAVGRLLAAVPTWPINRRADVNAEIGFLLSGRFEGSSKDVCDPLNHEAATPLELAQWQGHASVVDMLRAAGAVDAGVVSPLEAEARRVCRAALDARNVLSYDNGGIERLVLPRLRLESIKRKELLGRGAFGGVYRVEYDYTPSSEPLDAALKITQLSGGEEARKFVWEELTACVCGFSTTKRCVCVCVCVCVCRACSLLRVGWVADT